MSIDSSLIVRRDTLPTAAEVAAAVAETGVELIFPADFAFDQTLGGWVPVMVDGTETGFDYGTFALADWPEEELPGGAEAFGETVLSFEARGSLSAHTVNLIQQIMGRRWGAALWIEDEVVPPDPNFGPGASLADLHVSYEPEAGAAEDDIDPDLAATMRGSPAERAAALDRYVAKLYPPVPRDRRAEAVTFLKPLILPILIFLALGGFYAWSQLN